MKRDRMAEGIRIFLEGLLEGEDLSRLPGLADMTSRTPERVAEAWLTDLASGYGEDPAERLHPQPLEAARGPVVLTNLHFTSICAHHLLPYSGFAHLGFDPEGGHVGLGALARLVSGFARRLTLQEQLTADIADALHAKIAPRGVLVALEAEHHCLAARGPRSTGHVFRTLERRGEPSAALERLVLDARRIG